MNLTAAKMGLLLGTPSTSTDDLLRATHHGMQRCLPVASQGRCVSTRSSYSYSDVDPPSLVFFVYGD